MLGVVIAQLMRLQRSPNPDPVLGFYVISIPLSSVCHIMALLISCLGCYRFFEWQTNMARGQAISGGWIIYSIFILAFLVSETCASLGPELTSTRYWYAYLYWSSPSASDVIDRTYRSAARPGRRAILCCLAQPVLRLTCSLVFAMFVILVSLL